MKGSEMTYNDPAMKLEIGDRMSVTVTLQLVTDHTGKSPVGMAYELYKGEIDSEEIVPRGTPISSEYAETIVKALFPIVKWRGCVPK